MWINIKTREKLLMMTDSAMGCGECQPGLQTLECRSLLPVANAHYPSTPSTDIFPSNTSMTPRSSTQARVIAPDLYTANIHRDLHALWWFLMNVWVVGLYQMILLCDTELYCHHSPNCAASYEVTARVLQRDSGPGNFTSNSILPGTAPTPTHHVSWFALELATIKREKQ